MEPYDLHIYSELEYGSLEDVVELAQRLGYSGIGITHVYRDRKKLKSFLERIKELRKNSSIDIVTCAEIVAENKQSFKRSVSAVRGSVDVVIVKGGEYEINRFAVEDSRVDILSTPEYKRNDSGLDHSAARLAAQHNVAIEINFHSILETYRKIRSHLFTHMRTNIMLCKKYGAPLVVCSGAKGKGELRDPRELAAMLQLLGMELTEARDSITTVPKSIVETNRKKLSGKIKFKGVEVI